MTKNQMTLFEKITLIISILVLIITSVGVVSSNNISSLFGKIEIVYSIESVKLDKFLDKAGYLEIINIKNKGLLTSEKINIVVNFKDKIPDFKTFSEEPILSTTPKDNTLIISLERLSNNTSLRLILFSNESSINSLQYIDNNGKKTILENYDNNNINLLNLFFLICIIISILVIIWVYRRSSEKYLITIIENHNNELNERFREIIDEIGNIEITLNEPSIKLPEEKESKVTSRLSVFLSKNFAK